MENQIVSGSPVPLTKHLDLSEDKPGDITLTIVRGNQRGTSRPLGDRVWVCERKGCVSVCFKVGGSAEPSNCTYCEDFTSSWRRL